MYLCTQRTGNFPSNVFLQKSPNKCLFVMKWLMVSILQLCYSFPRLNISITPHTANSKKKTSESSIIETIEHATHTTRHISTWNYYEICAFKCIRWTTTTPTKNGFDSIKLALIALENWCLASTEWHVFSPSHVKSSKCSAVQ